MLCFNAAAVGKGLVGVLCCAVMLQVLVRVWWVFSQDLPVVLWTLHPALLTAFAGNNNK